MDYNEYWEEQKKKDRLAPEKIAREQLNTPLQETSSNEDNSLESSLLAPEKIAREELNAGGLNSGYGVASGQLSRSLGNGKKGTEEKEGDPLYSPDLGPGSPWEQKLAYERARDNDRKKAEEERKAEMERERMEKEGLTGPQWNFNPFPGTGRVPGRLRR